MSTMRDVPEPFRPETVAVSFSLSELWMLQQYVRHEIAQQETWRKPPADLDLNEMVADGIYTCVEFDIDMVNLLLNAHHLLILDAVIPQSAKDADGRPVGKQILLKSFKARRELAGEKASSVDEPDPVDVATAMAEFNERYCDSCKTVSRKE